MSFPNFKIIKIVSWCYFKNTRTLIYRNKFICNYFYLSFYYWYNYFFSNISFVPLVLWINGLVSLALIVASKCNLRLDSQSPLLTRTALAPSILIVISVVMFFFVPPAEYVIGGRDPGVYINEGIQITQRGSLVNTDSVIRPIPPDFKHLFFPTI